VGDNKLERWVLSPESIVGTKWVANDGQIKGGLIEFQSNGKIKVFHNQDSTNPNLFWNGWKYSFIDGDLHVTPSESSEQKVRLSRKDTRMEITTWGEFELEKGGEQDVDPNA
jgi:hypothetical protein